MILGPPEIIYCPFCNAVYQKQSLISGNTFGGIHFSDGQHFYPMLPSHPQLTICDTCNNFFWVKDLESTENMRDYQGDDDPPFVRWPEQEEWIRALSQVIFRDPTEEIYIRTHLWWVLNNKFRVEDRIKPANEVFPGKLYEENLFALLRLHMAGKNPDYLLLAEMHRELGFFEKALELLEQIEDGDYKDIVRQISEKALQKNPYMFKLTS
jgi:hypothetical protein